MFVSYTRGDGDFALRLASALKEHGASIWLDQLDVPLGAHWDRAVEDALRASDLLLVILTPESVSSMNVMDEVAFAIEEKKTVIPVLYKPCQVPFRLRRLQYVDFTTDYEQGLGQLLRSLRLGPASAAANTRIAEISSRTSQISQDQRSTPVIYRSKDSANPLSLRRRLLAASAAESLAVASIGMYVGNVGTKNWWAPALFFGTIWGFAGFIVGFDLKRIQIAAVCAAAAGIVPVFIGTTLQQRLEMALFLACPLGAVLGAIICAVRDRRGRSRSAAR